MFFLSLKRTLRYCGATLFTVRDDPLIESSDQILINEESRGVLGSKPKLIRRVVKLLSKQP